MNAILMSIRPEWAVKEMNGEKTEEIRKNLGKLQPPFKVYAYVTKGKPELCYPFSKAKKIVMVDGWQDELRKEYLINGKVCFEFVCDRVESISAHFDVGDCKVKDFDTCSMNESKLLQASCLSKEELHKYFFGKRFCAYSLHISELKVYDTPKELGEFHKVGFNEAMKNWEWDRLSPPDEKSILIPCPAPRYEIKKAPQSWQFVEELK